MKSLMITLLLSLPFLMVGTESQHLVGDVSGMIARNVDQITSLGDAIPADKYNWSPSEGVRSVEKSMLHVASVNYMLGSASGGPYPIRY